MTNLPKLKILYTGADPSVEVDTRELTPLIHVHIPKCAGTTLDHVMLGVAKAFGRPFFRFLGTIYDQGFSGTEKEEAWQKGESLHYPQDWLYASGHIPYGCFPDHGTAVHEVSIIRDPSSRLISMFWMGVRQGAWKATTPVNNLIDTGLFAPESLVRQLCGERSRDRQLDEGDLERAVDNFLGIEYAGLIEDFDTILGAILAAYKIPYVAYHSYQVGESGRDHERDRLTEQFAPFMALDQAFYDRAAASCAVPNQTREISIGDVAPNAPVLMVSPNVVSQSSQNIDSAFVDVKTLATIFGL